MNWKRFSMEDAAGVLAELETAQQGLSSQEARRRLAGQKGEFLEDSLSLRTLITRRAKSAFFYLLLIAAAVSFFWGDRFEAWLILAFIAINAGFEFYQEYHTEKAKQKLSRYLSTRARVVRRGIEMTIESAKIVPGDIVLLKAGDRVPADMRLITTDGLVIDENVLSGESAPAYKCSDLLSVSPIAMFEAKNIGFAGTVVIAGTGTGVAYATGRQTALSDISHFSESDVHKTRFEKEILRFSRFILRLVALTLILIFLANVFLKGESIGTSEMLIFSLALAVSVIPEALSVIITVALSRGSLRLAQKRVVMRRLPAVEDLGSIDVLCADKTGILTENILTVQSVRATDHEQCLTLALASALALPEERSNLHDAFDIALWQKLDLKHREAARAMKRIDNIPFDPARRRNSVLVEAADGTKRIIVRGAPEDILRLSTVSSFEREQYARWYREAGQKGERVLAVAVRDYQGGTKYTLYEEQELRFVGLISFSDQVKADAMKTIRKAEALNVRVKIISGDRPEVVGSIGYAAGLVNDPEDIITGKELLEMSYDERKRAIEKHALFARVTPLERYEMIKTLREKHTVAFIGESISDATSIKLADVGIVPREAPDISRDAADVVLLRPDLGAVIDGIKEGRVIFANIMKYLTITLTANFGNFYSIAIASLFLPFVPILPIQILLLNLLSDFPMLAIARDTVDEEELKKPENYRMHSIVLIAAMLGAVSSVFDFMLFGAFEQGSPEVLQTAWFILSVVTEVVLIYSLRTKLLFFRARRPSSLLISLSLLTVGLVALIPFTAIGAEWFHFVRPDVSFIAVVMSLSLAYFITNEMVKRFYHRHFRDTPLLSEKKPVTV